jgi:type IV pilus assembly protein PilX
MNIDTAHIKEMGNSQRGAALITGLIFMVVLTLIGITAARMASLEERMSGNVRDRALAMQAAEMALRDAERDILLSGRVNGLSDFTAACTNGLCYNGPAGYSTPVWTTVSMTAAPSIQYASQTTNAPPLNMGLSAPPRYLIEGMEKFCWRKCESSLTPGYRITVRAQGANPNTVVWLQEIFKP